MKNFVKTVLSMSASLLILNPIEAAAQEDPLSKILFQCSVVLALAEDFNQAVPGSYPGSHLQDSADFGRMWWTFNQNITRDTLEAVWERKSQPIIQNYIDEITSAGPSERFNTDFKYCKENVPILTD